MMHMFGYGYPGSLSSGWGIWMFAMMAFWIAVTVGIVIFILKFVRKDSYSSNSALELLDMKLANGEIGEKEYLQKKQILKEK